MAEENESVIRFKGFKPMEHQKAVINLLDEHPNGSTFVIKSARQRGKSLLMINLLLRQAINHNGTNSVMIEPTSLGCRRVFKDILAVVQNTPIYKGANATYFDIEFKNGSSISLRSAEAKDSLRGISLKKDSYLILDEAAFIDEETMLITFPFADVNKCNIILVSTPKFEDNKGFHKYYKLALEGERNFYLVDFNEYDTSELLTPEKYEEYKKTLPFNIFLNEICGEFLKTEGNVFGDFSKVLSNGYMGDGGNVIGIDFASGTGNDETAIVCFNSQKQMVGLWHFSDETPTKTIEIILDKIKAFHPKKVVIEINSIGEVYKDLLKLGIKRNGLHCQLICFYTSNKSKRKIIEELQVNIQNQTITLVDDVQLKLEFAGFELKQTANGNITYGNASNSIHDDIVMATALSLYGFNKGTYHVR